MVTMGISEESKTNLPTRGELARLARKKYSPQAAQTNKPRTAELLGRLVALST